MSMVEQMGVAGALPYAGIPVIESPHALKETERPAREHEWKPWMKGRAYHARIQKKWIARFGYEEKPCVWQTPAGIVAHPTLMATLRSALASQDGQA